MSKETESLYAEACTNSTVSIQLVAKDGKQTDWIVLDNFWRNDFEQGQVDEFEIKSKDVGRPAVIRLKLQHGFFGKDVWAGEEVMVQSAAATDYFPLHDWVENFVEVARCDAKLPQKLENETLKQQRKAEISKNKTFYVWNDKNQQAVLPRHHAATEYSQLPKVFQQEDIRKNFFNDNIKISRRNVLLNVIKSIFKEITEIEDFKNLFLQEDVPDDLPPNITEWDTDEEFGRQMLNGINPCAMQRCDKLPTECSITSDMVKAFLREETLEAAIKNGRVYIINYFESLKDVDRNVNAEGVSLYCPDAMCLFYSRSDGNLVPIAVQLEAGKSDCIFTPADTKEDWIMAKMYFRCIDANFHEWITHYVRTHAAIEPVAIALFRCLPRSHPIHKLLRPHVYAIPTINTMARNLLLSATSTTNICMGINGAKSALKYYKTFTLGELDIPSFLDKNGTLDKTLLPKYWYRDDVLTLWKIVEKYVSGVIRHFYKCPGDIQGDHELQDWISEIAHEGIGWDGNLRGTPTSFADVDDLVKFCTIVVATSSVQHAAVNFGQFDIYKFIPNAPSGMRKSAHTKGECDMDRIIATLPNTRMAVVKLGICFALSQYSPTEIYLGSFPRKLFYETEVVKIMKEFDDDLKKIGVEIDKRNSTLKFPYQYLHPSRIPAGITV